MTAPDTNVEKQTRRQEGSFGGIALSVVLMGCAVAAWVIFASPEETVSAQDTNAVTDAETEAAATETN